MLMSVTFDYNFDHAIHVVNINSHGANDAISIFRQRNHYFSGDLYFDDVYVNGTNVTQGLFATRYPGTSPPFTINVYGNGNNAVTLYDDRDIYATVDVLNVYGAGGGNSLTLVHQTDNYGIVVSSTSVQEQGCRVNYYDMQTVQVNITGSASGEFSVANAPNPGTQFVFVGGTGTNGLRFIDPNTSADLGIWGRSPNTPGYNGGWWNTNNTWVSFYNLERIDTIGSSTDMHTAEFLVQTYWDLLGRTVEFGGFRTHSIQFNQGWSRSQVVRNILGSTEYEAIQVRQFYTAYFGPNRPVSQGEINFYVGLLQSGWTMEQVQTQFLQSDEFFNRQGRSLPNFVIAVYQIVWGYNPQQWEINGQVSWMNSGATRGNFVTAMFNDSNHVRALVRSDFASYLRRGASDNEVNIWVNTQRQYNMRDEDILANIIGSDEYFTQIAQW